MKALIKKLVLNHTFPFVASLVTLICFAILAFAGPYPGTIPAHGHTGPNDGGALAAPVITGRLSIAGSTHNASGFFVGTSSLTTSGVTVDSVTSRNGIFISTNGISNTKIDINHNNATGDALYRVSNNGQAWVWGVHSSSSSKWLISPGETLDLPAIDIDPSSKAVNFATAPKVSTFQMLPVLQIVQGAQVSPSSTTTSSSFKDTTMAVTITPKLNTSKILVTCQGQDGETIGTCNLAIGRNGTPVSSSFLGSGGAASGTNSSMFNMVYYDSPATTSATTYSIMFAAGGGIGTATVNAGNCIAIEYGQ